MIIRKRHKFEIASLIQQCSSPFQWSRRGDGYDLQSPRLHSVCLGLLR